MSYKLLIEFYDLDDDKQPVSCVLAFHGGDNPSGAATTLTDFFDALADLPEPSFDDASLLSARFIVWESGRCRQVNALDFTSVTIIPFNSLDSCQIARVYARQVRPFVCFPANEWTSAVELYEAALILRQSTVVSLAAA